MSDSQPQLYRLLGSWTRPALDALAVATATGFVLSYFPASLLFASTTTNGGDMASHYYSAVYLREVLLPHGRISGWCPGNYCGFPLFQFYFPLPFLIAAALSAAVPLTVAFKLATVLGTVLLPGCAYLGLRLCMVPFPGPALAALSVLCFLFMEANSMWGGNIPSTLAGEFSFSLGLSLAVVFIGLSRRIAATGRGRVAGGVLVAAIGLAHGFTLLWAGLVSLLELVAARQWWRRAVSLVAVHGLAVLLLAGWLVPLLWYLPWTTAFNHVWPISSWREVLPPILWPCAVLAVASGLAEGLRCLVRRESFPRSLATIWGAALMSVLFYAAAGPLQLPDVRCLSFLQLTICLLAAAGVGHVVGRIPLPEVWPVAAGLAVLPFVAAQVSYIPGWIRWNYSGFEAKALWPVFRSLNDHLRGTFRDPRVVYEHSPDNEALGTVRAFENLPLFSGRSTLEGLYMQSSPMAPFVFFVQSEISKAQSCPLPNWGCSRFNLEQGVEHLRMLNVSQFIVRSAEVKKAAAASSELKREAVFGPYEVHRVVGAEGRYVVPLRVAPVLVVTDRWKEVAYSWFKRATTTTPVPVFVDHPPRPQPTAFAGVFTGLPSHLPRRPLGAPPHLREHLEIDRITVTGCRPGHPILFRVSYHPRWHAVTGERVWLAGPSFMLVVPRSERVELVFGDPPAVRAGWALSLLGLVVAFLGSVFGARVERALERAPGVRVLVGTVRRTAAWSQTVRRRLLAVALACSVLIGAGGLRAAWRPHPDRAYRRGQRLYTAGRFDEALAAFEEARQIAPLSMSAIHASFHIAIIYFRQQHWAEAEAEFRRLVEELPEALNIPEALYHIGLCRLRQGDSTGAAETWREVQRRFPDSQWARAAGDRLAELRPRQPGGRSGM